MFRYTIIGGFAGLSIGIAATCALGYYTVVTPAIRCLMILYPGLLLTAAGSSYRSYRAQHRRNLTGAYINVSEKRMRLRKSKIVRQRHMDLLYKYRYWMCSILWITALSMSLVLMRCDPLMSSTQKLIQACAIAQKTSITALLIVAVVEIRDMMQTEEKY